MGGCCSCEEDPRRVDKAERELANPMPPYADWAEKLKQDWGSDPTAVSRDLARMRIMVTGPDGPRTRLTDMNIHSGAVRRAEMEKRNEELKHVVVAISKLVEPAGSETPARIEAAWDAAINHNEAIEDSPDISIGLTRLLSTDLAFYRDRNDVTDDAKARSPTFNALLLFAQGTVFYPGQRIAHLMWLPWARHLRDVAWTVYVTDDDRFPNADYYATHHPAIVRNGNGTDGGPVAGGADANGMTPQHNEQRALLGTPAQPIREQEHGYGSTTNDRERDPHHHPATRPEPVVTVTRRNSMLRRRGQETISVVHSFALQNYIDPEEARDTPKFQLSWAVVITLKKATGEWVSASLEQPEVVVEKVEGRRKLKALRREQLADAAFNAFGVQLQEVDHLQPVTHGGAK